ncbi:MAG: gliding motility-associated C-terminal domain-containing protein [Bacteroidia bacterium]|nr:gliding motility-associated C-terminal domain-containing protein [Bacteroidia bacterium]
MRILLIIITLITFSKIALGQKEGNLWFFGDSVLMNFNTNPPSLVDGVSITSQESSSILCDSEGNLKLYTEGWHLLNKNHQTVSGWNFPFVGSVSADNRAQGSILIPLSDSLSFLGILHSGSGGFFLRYSLIDSLENNGLGRVFLTDFLLEDSLTEHLAAVRHADGKRWWVLAHKKSDLWTKSNRFVKILLGANKSFESSYQNIGMKHVESFYDYGAPLIFNDQADMFSVQVDFGTVEFYSFDRCTGDIQVFGSIIKPPSTETDYFSQAFSPNGRFFYGTQGVPTEKGKVYQYDLWSDDILGSETLVGETSKDSMSFIHAKLAPNGKIYIGNENGKSPYRVDFMSVIHNPNLLGAACNFEYAGFSLAPYTSGGGLPNIPNYRLGKLIAQEAEAGPGKTICKGESTQLGIPDTTGKMAYYWSPSDGLDFPMSAQPTASPGVTTTYYLSAIDRTMCPEWASSFDSVTVTVKSDCAIEIPSLLSLNGDGINDLFEIKNLKPGTQLQITDYLGRRIFYSNNYQNDWPNGSLILSQGVYFYWVEDPQEGAMAGRVVVVR